MTYGMSRDDASPFLMPTIAREITKEDPTVSIDMSGVKIDANLRVCDGWRLARPS